jgi:hypothetical protein
LSSGIVLKDVRPQLFQLATDSKSRIGVIPLPLFPTLTMREGWLPTQLQADFIDLIHNRIIGSLMPDKSVRPPAAMRPGSAKSALAR